MEGGKTLAVRYGGAVPRYTSYPTAPHFSGLVNGDVYAEWLGTIGSGDKVSLYLHIPFCHELCWYCGCFTKIVRRYKPVAGYVESLLREIDMVVERLAGKPEATCIHFGGGSPTILDPRDWQRVMNRLRASFDIAADAEIAVEIDPRTMDESYIRALADAGVNRASIGIQEFDEDIQRRINRVQPFQVTAQVVGWLRSNGIESLNLDLMYGLPKQTVRHVEDMTARALAFKANRIALFGYAHVPWMKTHQRLIRDDELPGLEERWHQASRAAEILVENGYVRVGFDHFALPGDPIVGEAGGVGRNFQGYTADTAETLIGFGASAISSMRQGYAQNVASLPSYAHSIEAGLLPVRRGVALSDDDRLRRFVINRIMCDMQADIGRACEAHGLDAGALDTEIDTLRPMVRDGLLDITGRTVTVTEVGRPLVRNVAAAFDAYLSTGEGRHSAAV
ncbi:MAG: oxygen-independent coproporphyrinogen III oxidase [Rhodospirillales bacterium]|nr:oxygen-independent coproporphyrinogen III oxidase [Rhodospirillales bacterium]MBO6785889.1 oxygen-independent coproporphyrinogen III oxidase [Rhodospirillales bacterium]